MAGEPEVTLDGTLERITFRGDEYYTVARFAPDGAAPITIVGKLVEVNEGMPITVHGQWVEDRKYGRQFKVAFAHPRTPKTIVGIEKFLGSGLIKGVGRRSRSASSRSSAKTRSRSSTRRLRG